MAISDAEIEAILARYDPASAPAIGYLTQIPYDPATPALAAALKALREEARAVADEMDGLVVPPAVEAWMIKWGDRLRGMAAGGEE